jgi:hypothetical protein
MAAGKIQGNSPVQLLRTVRVLDVGGTVAGAAAVAHKLCRPFDGGGGVIFLGGPEKGFISYSISRRQLTQFSNFLQNFLYKGYLLHLIG